MHSFDISIIFYLMYSYFMRIFMLSFTSTRDSTCPCCFRVFWIFVFTSCIFFFFPFCFNSGGFSPAVTKSSLWTGSLQWGLPAHFDRGDPVVTSGVIMSEIVPGVYRSTKDHFHSIASNHICISFSILNLSYDSFYVSLCWMFEGQGVDDVCFFLNFFPYCEGLCCSFAL